jgi:ankyrin repeat protein
VPARLFPLLAPVLLGGCLTGLGRPAPARPADPAAVPPVLAALRLTDPDDWKHGLGAAVRAGDLPRVQLWLAARPDLLNETSRMHVLSATPLQAAVEENHLPIVEFLLACGADVEVGREETPLRIAARGGHRKAAGLLLARGAVPDLYSAVALDDRAEVERQLRLAAALGLGRWVANTRSREPGGYHTPLVCVAYSRGHADMVALLVRYGADPRAEVIHRPCYINDNRFEGVTAGVTPAVTLYDLP